MTTTIEDRIDEARATIGDVTPQLEALKTEAADLYRNIATIEEEIAEIEEEMAPLELRLREAETVLGEAKAYEERQGKLFG